MSSVSKVNPLSGCLYGGVLPYVVSVSVVVVVVAPAELDVSRYPVSPCRMSGAMIRSVMIDLHS